MKLPFHVPVTSTAIPTPQDGALVRLFNVSPRVLPGDPLAIQGAFEASASICFDYPGAEPAELFPLQEGAEITKVKNATTVLIPEGTPMEVYRVWKVENGVASAPAYVNRCKPRFMTCTIVKSGLKVYVQGDNLLHTVGLTKVFYGPNIDSLTEAAIDWAQCTKNTIKHTVPVLANGAVVKVFVSNGYGNDELVETPGTVTINNNADTIGLGDKIPWNGLYTFGNNLYHFAYDTNLPENARHSGNDTEASTAFRNAIVHISNTVKNGVKGGVLLVPSGLYRVFLGVELESNVILRFANDALTYLGGDTTGQRNAFTCVGKQYCGFQNIQYENRSTEANLNPFQNMYIANNVGFVIDGGSFKLNESIWAETTGNTFVVHKGYSIQQGAIRQVNTRRHWMAEHSTGIIIDVTSNFVVDAFNAASFTGLIENLRMTWNAEIGDRQRVVNHQLACSEVKHLVVRNCVFNNFYGTYGKKNNGPKDQGTGNAQQGNDGENVIVEKAAGSDASDITGNITTASLTKIIDSSKDFSVCNFPSTMTISYGVGEGMSAKAIGLGANNQEVILDRTLPMLPGVGAGYSIAKSSVEFLLVEKNQMFNAKRMFLDYFSESEDCYFNYNTGTESGMADWSTKMNNLNGQRKMTIHKNNECIGNRFTGDNVQAAMIMNRAVCIQMNNSFGVMLYNPRVEDNILINTGPNVPSVIDSVMDSGIGFVNQVEGVNWVNNLARPVGVNAIACRNTIVNCKFAIYTCTGWMNVVAMNNKIYNTVGGVSQNNQLNFGNAVLTAYANVKLPGNAIGAKNFVKIGNTVLSQAPQ